MASPIEEEAPTIEESAAELPEAEAEAPEAPIPAALAGIVARAVAERATDVHLDAWTGAASLRFRVDGKVHEKERLSAEQARTLVNQMKIAAELEIDVRREPLEGQFVWRDDEAYRDIRVTIVPTAPHHQSAHLRLLRTPDQGRAIEELGMSDQQLEQVRSAMSRETGLALITGPTGSGKTTTLYALVGMGDVTGRVTASIEDPVELDLPHVRQVEVDEEHGITMEMGLRTVLRMDPDVLVVGEVRDRASAVIAGHAALAGRMVMATLHGRDAAAAIEAMHFRSVPYYVLAAALRLVTSQSLVRKVCPSCAEHRKPRDDERELFERHGVDAPDELAVARGCDECMDYGFRGRTGVFEVVAVDDTLAVRLADGPRQHELRELFAERGFKPLSYDALGKVAAGVTTLEEVLPLLSAAGADVTVPHPNDR